MDASEAEKTKEQLDECGNPEGSDRQADLQL